MKTFGLVRNQWLCAEIDVRKKVLVEAEDQEHILGSAHFQRKKFKVFKSLAENSSCFSTSR